VDFTFSDEQEALRQAVRGFLAKEAPNEYVREMADSERGFTDTLWNRMAEMGFTGLLVPRDHGGLGLGSVDLAVVMEEMGRLPLPGPYLSSAVLATLAARRLGATDLLADLASGARRGTVAFEQAGGGYPVERIRTRAVRRGSVYLLNGLQPLVLDGHSAHWAIVPARSDRGLGSYLVDSPDGVYVPTMDPTRKAARIDLVDRPAMSIGPRCDHTAIWQRVFADAAVAVSAELLGVAGAALDMSIEYSKQRVQFDKPIASFQAIKHKIVDMYHSLELARAGTHFAAWASDADDEARSRAVAMAKSYTGEAAVRITGDAIQIHGGVGFTWACDAHLFYKRAKQNDLMLGGQSSQRRELAHLVLDPA
jgi:alkylation response protein AidB-like acyl-CoA dehydrogenase